MADGSVILDVHDGFYLSVGVALNRFNGFRAAACLLTASYSVSGWWKSIDFRSPTIR